MSTKPNLLVKDNLVRHLSAKIEKLKGLKNVISTIDEPTILEGLLALSVSFFEAAILDTVREYVYAKPDEIYESMLKEFDEKDLDTDRNNILSKGFEEYMLEAFLEKIACEDNKTKIKSLAKLTGIKVKLDNERWKRILEIFARRNCLIHNDLVVNNIYFKQAGQKAEDISPRRRLIITEEYISSGVEDLISLLGEVKSNLDVAYQDRTRVAAVKELWNYLFDNHYPFIFEECWNTDGESVKYKGPHLEAIEDSSSPRMICLFSAWMSLFGNAYYGDLKNFSTIFYLNSKDRNMYTRKLKYLMDAFEKVDFQEFRVEVYAKPS